MGLTEGTGLRGLRKNAEIARKWEGPAGIEFFGSLLPPCRMVIPAVLAAQLKSPPFPVAGASRILKYDANLAFGCSRLKKVCKEKI